jgi:hypothetical protein
MGTWEGRKEKLLIEFDKESSLVDKRFEISNLLWDMAMIIKLADYSG